MRVTPKDAAVSVRSVLNLCFRMPRGPHGPPTAPAKRTTAMTDEQWGYQGAGAASSLAGRFTVLEVDHNGLWWSVVTSQNRASVFRGSSRQRIWRPAADTEGEWPHNPSGPNAPHGRDGTSARRTMLDHFSTAQPTSIHRRIMLARGVIVPQRQTLRAVTFAAAVVGEAIHAPVSDAERQLLEHHVHRDHSALVSRESCATRSVAAGINAHHPATPSSHIERLKFSSAHPPPGRDARVGSGDE